MKLYHIVAVLIWITTVTATSESDSRGNWSNEKELVYEQERIDNRTKEEIIIGNSNDERIFNSSESTESIEAENPEELEVKFAEKKEDNHEVKNGVLPPVDTIDTQEDTYNKSINNVTRLTRTSENSSNETLSIEYIPSKEEILVENVTTTTPNNYYSVQDNFSNLAYPTSEEHANFENVGDFGQRVRSSSFFRSKSNENLGRGRFRPSDAPSSSEDYRKQHRKGSRPLLIKKLNVSDSIANLFPKDRRPIAPAKASESQRLSQLRKTEEERIDTDYNKIKLPATSWTSNLDERKKHDSEENAASSSKDTTSSTSAPVQQVSLGKFTGPIVVADLPHQRNYPFATSTSYTTINDDVQSNPASVETVKSKVAEPSYLATSSAVLNPLQVGVALMNVGQDINTVNDPVTFTKNYLRDQPVTGIESIIQNDAVVDSGNSSLQTDQLSQQEQISEVVASKGPTQSVEIQKSVEVFHTAPVHEIHYPVEFVPYVQRSNFKQRQQQIDYRKPQRVQQKDQRASQLNIYKSNEVLDETVSSNNQEQSRYEYNVNEDDGYSINGRVDQTVAHSTDVKPVFDAREQSGDVQDDQTAGKYSRIQRIPDTVTAEDTKNEFDPANGVPSFGGQPVRITDNLPALASVENPQGSEEAPVILLTKPTNEAPAAEVRFLTSVPQHYPGEKVYVHHALNVNEKKVPSYQVEKVIEKQITIPQPFPVHVPVDRVVEKQIRIPYPVHVEKVIEKKVPLAIQRFIIPLPIHFRIPQPVPIPVEKVVEKSVPVPVPIPVEKVIEKTVHHPRSHPLDVEKIKPSYPLENLKLKTVPSLTYNDGNFQQIRQQNFQTPLGASNEKNHYNSTQFFGSGYRPPFVRQPSLRNLPNKFGSYGIQQYPRSLLLYSSLNGNNGNFVLYGRSFPEKDKVTDEYVGPVPRKVQLSLGIQSKSLQHTPPDVQSTMRRTRQEGGNTGTFRQSKMEYGFKPPMVPSIQYDEQTATKVE